MKLVVVQDDVELIGYVNQWLQQYLANLNIKNILLPAGSTPINIYKNWEALHPEFLKTAQFQQLDEIITGPKAGYFKTFFKKHLPTYFSQFTELAAEAQKPGLALLGVGLNGHLAFHEPEINHNLNYGCVKLSEITCKSLQIDEPTWGLTYGAAHFIKCPAVLIVANGSSKKEIVRRALSETEASSAFSYILKMHPNCTLLVDKNSYHL